LEEELEEEFDLRPYIEAVTRNWKWVIGAAILAAVIAFTISSLIPPTYEATALVAVTEPRQVVQFDPRIKTTEENQPVKAYPELATSDELLSLLLEEAVPIAPEVTNLASLKGLLSAKAGSDPSLINLSVKYADPQAASEITNKWAEMFVIRANEVFGTQGDEQLGFFEDQLLVASQDLQQAEQDLIDFQARDRSMLLDNELIALQQTQADQLAKRRQIALLLQDAESLHEQLTDASDRKDTPSAEQIALVLLQLRTFGGVPSADITTPWQLQLNVDQLSGMDQQDQIAFLSGLQNTLAAQVKQINEHLAELEPQILAAQQVKQEAVAEGTRLNRNLTVAEETYTALAHKVEEGKITSQSTGSGVRLASRSAVPEAPSGRGTLFILAVAMLLGIFLSVLVIIVVTWWQA
jgi:uncharacterized protein involved in exopolysaccharide biosynthesis